MTDAKCEPLEPVDILGGCPHCGAVTVRTVRERNEELGIVRCKTCGQEFAVQLDLKGKHGEKGLF